MVNLTQEMIEVIGKLNEVLKNSSFEINNFEVGSTGADGEMIIIDIRRHK